jgi:hypothetical protein
VSANAGATFQELFELLSDQVAKGYEATIVGNPTPNWRVSVGVARNESVESNIGTQHFAFIKERLPVWANYLNRPIVATPTITVGQLLPVAMQSWNYIRQSEGLVNPLGRKYRATATTRYGFSQGWLRGAFVRSSNLAIPVTLAPTAVVGLRAAEAPVGNARSDSFVGRWEAEWTPHVFTSVEFQHQDFDSLAFEKANFVDPITLETIAGGLPIGIKSLTLGPSRLDRVSASASFWM